MGRDRAARDRDVAEALDLDPNDPEDRETLDEIEAEFQAAGGFYVLCWTPRQRRIGQPETPQDRLPPTDDGNLSTTSERQSDGRKDDDPR